MKDTPVTNEYIKLINETIHELSIYTDYDEEPFVCLYPNVFAKELEICTDNLRRINIDLVKVEFVDTLEDYNKIFFQKKLFEFKFERLLNWKHDYENGIEENWRKFRMEFNEFTDYQSSFHVDISSKEYKQLNDIYINLSSRLTILKHSVKSMLVHYEELGKIYIQENNLKIVPSEDKILQKKAPKENSIKVKPASKKKTDIIKLISAMYDAKLFADADGNPITNKQKLMDAFGEFFGDDFSAYSTSLSQAKTRDEKTFIKPFKVIEKEALRCFYAVVEK